MAEDEWSALMNDAEASRLGAAARAAVAGAAAHPGGTARAGGMGQPAGSGRGAGPWAGAGLIEPLGTIYADQGYRLCASCGSDTFVAPAGIFPGVLYRWTTSSTGIPRR